MKNKLLRRSYEKTKITVTINKRDLPYLQQIADEESTGMSAFIREAIEEKMAKIEETREKLKNVTHLVFDKERPKV